MYKYMYIRGTLITVYTCYDFYCVSASLCPAMQCLALRSRISVEFQFQYQTVHEVDAIMYTTIRLLLIAATIIFARSIKIRIKFYNITKIIY